MRCWAAAGRLAEEHGAPEAPPRWSYVSSSGVSHASTNSSRLSGPSKKSAAVSENTIAQNCFNDWNPSAKMLLEPPPILRFRIRPEEIFRNLPFHSMLTHCVY